MNVIKKILINAGTFIVVLLVLFVIAEIISRVVFTYTKEGPTAIHLQIFEESETYGWKHLSGAVDYHGYGDPTPEIRINSLGFRDDEITMDKPENTKRILVLGDSFTFGMGVAHEDIFTEVLEENLNNEDINYEVINAGSIGYTIDNQYLLLKEKGLDLNPDVVIVAFFTGNDVTELRRHDWQTDLNGVPTKMIDTKHYVDNENRLRYVGEEEPLSYFFNFINTRLTILENKLGLTGANDEPTLTWPAYLDPDDPNGDIRVPEFWNQIEIVFKALKKLLDEKAIKLVVVSIPMDVQTDKKYWNKHLVMHFDEDAYEKDRPQNKLKEITSKLGIDLVDLLPYFREADESEWLYFEKVDPHWTKEGHAFVAKIIQENLQL
jgi:hypothetical protein